jgi:hypothetical protein
MTHAKNFYVMKNSKKRTTTSPTVTLPRNLKESGMLVVLLIITAKLGVRVWKALVIAILSSETKM